MTNVPFLNSITNEMQKRKLKSDVVANALLDISIGNEKLDDVLSMNSSASEIDLTTETALKYKSIDILNVSFSSWSKYAGGGDSSISESPIDGFGVRLKTNNTINGYVVGKHTITPISFNDVDLINVELYILNANNSRNIRVTFMDSAVTANTAHMTGFSFFTPGKNIITYKIEDCVFTGTATKDSTFDTVLVSVTNGAYAQNQFVDVGRIVVGGRAKQSLVIINFDSGYNKIYDWAYPVMKKMNMKGNVYAMPSGTGLGDRMTIAKYKELYANGWDIGLYGNVDNMGANNHTKNGICTSQTIAATGNFVINGVYSSALDTPRIITIYIASGNEGSNYFTVAGLDKDGNAYSEIIQGPTSTSAKSYSVNRFSKVTSITAGVTCTVPVSFGTAFTAEEFKEQFTLQKAWLDENEFTRGWAHWAYPLGEFNSESEQWLKDSGFKTARTVVTGVQLMRNQNRALVNTYFSSCAVTLGDSGSLSGIQTAVNSAVEMGSDLFILGHLGGAVVPDQTTLNNTLAWLSKQERAGLIKIVSFSEYEKLLGL